MGLVRKIVLGLLAVALGAVPWIVYLYASHPSLEPYAALFAEPAGREASGPRLTVRFLGNTNLLLSDGETAILSDGFFTRPGVPALLFGTIAPDRAVIAVVLERAGVERLAAVIALHSHYDHAMDAPEVARLTGAMLVGSRSTANIGRGWGLAEAQIHVAVPGGAMTFGAFTVTLIESRHFEFASAYLRRRAMSGLVIDEPLTPPVKADAYKMGGAYSVLVEHALGNVLIQGSAGYLEGSLEGVQADVIFLGIGALGSQTDDYQETYYRETVAAVGASRIFAVHWDDLATPLADGLRAPRGLWQLFGFEFAPSLDFVLEKATLDPRVSVRLLPLWRPIVLYPAPRLES